MVPKDEDFKVIDRRSQNRDEETPKKTKGEDFVMEDSQDTGPQDIDFSTLIFSLATGALIQMGLAPDPISKKTTKNLSLAKQNIDILGVLQAKTKGNLTPDEDKLLESLLTEVRLKFVEAKR